MKPADKSRFLNAAQSYLPMDERIAKKIRRYGNAAVTVGMICKSAAWMVADSGINFPLQGISRYFKSQLWKWIAFRRVPELFVPMRQGKPPSHQEFFDLSLGDLLERAGGHWPGSSEDAARRSLKMRGPIERRTGYGARTLVLRINSVPRKVVLCVVVQKIKGWTKGYADVEQREG